MPAADLPCRIEWGNDLLEVLAGSMARRLQAQRDVTSICLSVPSGGVLYLDLASEYRCRYRRHAKGGGYW